MGQLLAASPASLLQPLTAAMIANALAGLLYVWSLFILPIENALGLDRMWLGSISSLSLVSFTAGVSLLPKVLARSGRAATAGLAVLLIAGGHLAFGLIPDEASLAAGYGLAFGAGSGLAYGLALSLAVSFPAATRAKGIGLTMAAFALSGIVLPLILGNWIASVDPDRAFLVIGLWALLPGALCVLLLRKAGSNAAGTPAQVAAAGVPRPDLPFFILSFVFFALCFVGLAIVSQIAAMAAASGLPTPAHAATALTLGYLVGSLFGAPMADSGSERPTVFLLGAAVGAGTLAMLSGTPAVFLCGSAAVGLAFGGAGSILPVLIGQRYGAVHIPALYGRMILAYGLAGLAGPSIAGVLFSASGSYNLTIFLCLSLAALSIAAAPLMPAARPAGETPS